MLATMHSPAHREPPHRRSLRHVGRGFWWASMALSAGAVAAGVLAVGTSRLAWVVLALGLAVAASGGYFRYAAGQSWKDPAAVPRRLTASEWRLAHAWRPLAMVLFLVGLVLRVLTLRH